MSSLSTSPETQTPEKRYGLLEITKTCKKKQACLNHAAKNSARVEKHTTDHHVSGTGLEPLGKTLASVKSMQNITEIQQLSVCPRMACDRTKRIRFTGTHCS